MKTTSKICPKRYQCAACGHESLITTNHYGECYPKCKACGWKRPLEMGQRHVCLEPVPEGMGTPEPWRMVRLSDLFTEGGKDEIGR